MSRRKQPRGTPAIKSEAPEQRRLTLTLQQQTMLMQAAQEVQAAQAKADMLIASVLAAASIGRGRIIEIKLDDAVPYLVVQVLTDA